MGCIAPQELCGRCTFAQAGFRIYFGERLLMVEEPTSVAVKSRLRAAIQATSKVPINYKDSCFQETRHWPDTPNQRWEWVDNTGTLKGASFSHNLWKVWLAKALVSSFFSPAVAQ